MPAPYFFLRPILSPDHAWAAFDWQCANPGATPSSDYVSTFTGADGASLAGLTPFVTTITANHLRDDELSDGLDAGQVYYVLPPDALDDASVLERCKSLRHLGYHFGFDVDRANVIRRVPVAAFDYLRLDTTFARLDIPPTDLDYASDAGFGKIAAHVQTHELASWVAGKSFDYCDSSYLMMRDPHFGKEPDLTRLKLLKLLNIVKHDGDTREIEAIFREEPKLSYNLLRLVNSVAVSARTKISSFSQAIAILGRRQLQRWLQLLIYANNLADANTPNPLMQLAAARGRQMELLVMALEPGPITHELSDNAFMAGLFSLLDVLINLPMADIVRELPMHDDVVSALISPNGDSLLARLLSALIAAETGRFEEATEAFTQLHVSPELLSKTQVTAFHWASRINADADAEHD